MINPPQQQQQQQVSPVAPQLPSGVQNVYITYGGYYGRPRVMMTLESKPRRKLMAFAVSLLALGPLIVIFTSVCMAMEHYYMAYSYAAGVLYVVTGSIGVWSSKSNNPCGIRAVYALSIQCMVWSVVLVIAAAVIAAVMENRTTVTLVLEVVLAVIGLVGGILCLAVVIFFCKITCGLNNASVGGGAAMYPSYGGQPVVVYGQQQQQLPGGPLGPPAYNTAQQWPAVDPAAYQPQQYPSSSMPPSYDNVAADHKDKV